MSAGFEKVWMSGERGVFILENGLACRRGSQYFADLALRSFVRFAYEEGVKQGRQQKGGLGSPQSGGSSS